MHVKISYREGGRRDAEIQVFGGYRLGTVMCKNWGNGCDQDRWRACSRAADVPGDKGTKEVDNSKNKLFWVKVTK